MKNIRKELRAIVSLALAILIMLKIPDMVQVLGLMRRFHLK